MSDAKKQLSFDEYSESEGVRFDEIPTSRGVVKVGSVSSADILEWFDENEDPKLKKFAGLRLLAKSFINPDGSRIPKENREAAVAKFSQHDAVENGKLVKACLELNGLRQKAAQSPNASGEAPTDASPTGSQVH